MTPDQFADRVREIARHSGDDAYLLYERLIHQVLVEDGYDEGAHDWFYGTWRRSNVLAARPVDTKWVGMRR